MSITQKEGFIYIQCDSLKQIIALSQKSGILYCEDKTQYSSAELQLLDDDLGKELPLSVHLVKKVFKGEIIKIEPKSQN